MNSMPRSSVAISSVDAEAMVGRTSVVKNWNICTGKVCSSAPPTNSTITTSSHEARKAKSAAPKMLGAICGMVIL
jgi:hypothetical protein